MPAQLPLRWVKTLEPWVLNFFCCALAKIWANEARKCAYIEVLFELNKRRPCKYFMNFYPLYEGLNNNFLTKRCNHERSKQDFARPWAMGQRRFR